MFLGQESKYNGKFRATDSKNLPKLYFFITNPAKPLIFHCFPCQNFPAVNRSSRPADCGANRVINKKTPRQIRVASIRWCSFLNRRKDF